MRELKAIYDCIRKFKDEEGKIKKAKCAHYIIGKPGDEISGGLYLPADMKFPPEGIKIREAK